MLRKLLAGLGLGALAAVIVLGLAASTDLVDRLELTTYDWRMRVAADPKSVSQDIVLVEINDTTVRDMAQVFGRWPWPRVALSFVIEYLNRAPAKVIAVDISLPESDFVDRYRINDNIVTGSESDLALAESVKAGGNVIMLADAVNEGLLNGEQDKHAARWEDPGYRPGPRAERRPVVLAPYQALTEAAAALGHNFIALDPDGPARRMPPFIENSGKYLPTLGVAAALRAGAFRPDEISGEGSVLKIRDRLVPLVPVRVTDKYDRKNDHDQWTMLINYRGPAVLPGGKRPFPSYEFRHLLLSEQQLQSEQKPMVDPSLFKDKVVFIGFTASGLTDTFNTPFGGEGTMPGIQLHASMADSILANRFIRPAPGRSRIGAVLIAALAIGMLAAFLPFTTATLASLAILGGWTWLTVGAFKSGLWLNLVQPVAVGGLALFFGAAYQYFIEGREKRKVSKLFGRYVSRDVYSQLMANPDQAELGGKRREMTVLFSDIRGFTTVTERGDPEELVRQLNEYFSRMVEIVFRHKGTVDKFVGDMVMALFSAPLDDAEHANHAVQAAVDMVKELGELNRAWAAKGMTQLDIGIGVNSGDMIAGNIGSSSIMSYTVIGDNVNLGARLESLNKDYKTRIIISEATRARLTGDFQTRPLGDVIVKGKSKAVQIFEVQVPAPLVEEVKAT
jgi:adenylate cyclase